MATKKRAAVTVGKAVSASHNAEIKRVVAAIQKKTERVSQLRDELRALKNDLSDIIESLDEADMDFSDGIDNIERGLDRMSQYL